MRHYDRPGFVRRHARSLGGVDEPMMSAVPALGEHTEAIRAEFQR